MSSFNFPNTIGNEVVKKKVARAIEGGKVPHAYLIQGPEGSGLFAFAMDIAMILLCTDKNPPCMKCESCNKIQRNSHADFQVYHPFPSQEAMKMKEDAYWEYMRSRISTLVQNPYQSLSFEKEARFSIGTMRQIQKNFETGGRNSAWRIIVLCNVDRAGEEAANSILKTLEEPLPDTLFILLTTRPFMLLPTIISRCQVLRLGQLTEGEVLGYLRRKQEDYPLEKLAAAARFANGSIPRALDLLDGKLGEASELAEEFIRVAENKGLEHALDFTDKLVEKKDVGFLKKILEMVLIIIRDSCILISKSKELSTFQITSERAEQYLYAVKSILAGLEGNVIPNILLLTNIRRLQKGRNE